MSESWIAIAGTTLPQDVTEQYGGYMGSCGAPQAVRLALVGCEPLHARMTEAACIRRHVAARRTSDTTPCRTCCVGAQRAGLPDPSPKALWPFRDIKPGDVVDGFTVLDRHPFTYEGTRCVWVQAPDGTVSDESIWTLRRWRKAAKKRGA